MSNSTSPSNAASAVLLSFVVAAASCSRQHELRAHDDDPACTEPCPLFVYVDVLGRSKLGDKAFVENTPTRALEKLSSWKETKPDRIDVLDVGGSRFTSAAFVFDLARDAAELTDRVGFCADAAPGYACRDRVWVFETARATGRREPPSQLTRNLRLDRTGELWLDGESIGACRFNDDEGCARAVSRIDLQFDEQHVVFGADMFADWGDVTTLLRALHPIRRHVWALQQWDSLEERIENLRSLR